MNTRSAVALMILGCGASSEPLDGGDPIDGGDTRVDAELMDAGDECDIPITCALPPSGDDWLALGANRPTMLELEGVSPAIPVDYLATRNGAVTQVETGTACATALDRDDCTARLDAATGALFLARTEVLSASNLGAFVVFTRGDTVGVIDRREDLVAFFGVIDTPMEASLLIRTMPTMTLTAPLDLAYRPIRVRASGGGFEVVSMFLSSYCAPIIENQVAWTVDADGSITRGCQRVVGCDVSACI